MSFFLPAINVSLTDSVHDCSIQLNRGQWVKCGGAKGRIIDTETMSILWRHAGESFKGFILRFKRATTPKLRRARSFLRKFQLEFVFTAPLRSLSPLLEQIKAVRARLKIHKEVLENITPDTDAHRTLSRLFKSLHDRFLSLCSKYEKEGLSHG